MTPDIAGSPRLRLLWIATACGVTLHNLEEWLLDMTGWLAKRSWLPGHTLHGDQDRFAVVLTIITAAVLALAVVATVTRPTWSADTLVCVGYALVINGVSHLALSLVTGEVMPGMVTGVAVLLPLGGFIIRTLPPVPWTLSSTLTTILVVVGIMAGVLGPGFF